MPSTPMRQFFQYNQAHVQNRQIPPVWFVICLIVIALLALFGPEEKSLGSNVRIVYLHGARVLTAEIAFLAAGLAGLLGLPILAGAQATLMAFNIASLSLGRAIGAFLAPALYGIGFPAVTWASIGFNFLALVAVRQISKKLP